MFIFLYVCIFKERKPMSFNNYFLRQDLTRLREINELSAFLIQNDNPTDGQQLIEVRDTLTKLLSYDYTWLCDEHNNINRIIEENNRAIDADHERKNDDLYSKSYDLYFFHKYYILGPATLSRIANRYKFIFGHTFCEYMDNFHSKNKAILKLTSPFEITREFGLFTILR